MPTTVQSRTNQMLRLLALAKAEPDASKAELLLVEAARLTSGLNDTTTLGSLK